MESVAILCYVQGNLTTEVKNFIGESKNLYFNLTDSNLVKIIQSEYPNAIISTGQSEWPCGYLSLIKTWIQTGAMADLLIFCHTKSKLNSLNMDYISYLFMDANLGMVGSLNCLEPIKTNEVYKSYCEKFNLDWRNNFFINNGLFYVRANIFRNFFSKYPISEITRPELWKYLFGTIATKGHKIKPIENFKEIISVFDEQFYLEKYNDIKQAVKNGVVHSGLIHFLKVGRFENRLISRLKFDEWFYILFNPGVEELIKESNETAYDHFIKFGFAENRCVLWNV